jgi:hypothetical protein
MSANHDLQYLLQEQHDFLMNLLYHVWDDIYQEYAQSEYLINALIMDTASTSCFPWPNNGPELQVDTINNKTIYRQGREREGGRKLVGMRGREIASNTGRQWQ